MDFENNEFEKLRSDRLAYIEGLRRNKGFEAGILRLLTELYPDNAHFIYELLQNAEDTKATYVQFTLTNDSLIFEHDGTRLFSLRDVESITSIGDSTKADSPTEIGKFGVGFKAVFAYTDTPVVHSGNYHFRIHDLVVPELVPSSKEKANGFKTKFIFPLNHKTKKKNQAIPEISNALIALGDATLLFLSNIRRISYSLPDKSEGHLERHLPTDYDTPNSNGERILISVHGPGTEPRQSHWLRYQRTADIEDESGIKSCTVAVAWGLQEVKARSKKMGWRVVAQNPGKVCIYFPAEKETSNLRFHVHAPFASTVARDSVRDSVGNKKLVTALAQLASESIGDIRDRGLLTVEALETLPIIDDNLSAFYAPIRDAIVEAFKTAPLVPTKSGSHRAAEHLFRGPSDIVNLFSDEDLSILTNGKFSPPLWCENPSQLNQRSDKFLDSLKIDAWSWTELRESLLCDDFFNTLYNDKNRPARLHDWLAAKDDAWLQRFYALLHIGITRHHLSLDVSGLALVRATTDSGFKMVAPEEAFFPPPNEASVPGHILLAKPSTYSSGKSEATKNSARLFLEEAGVRVFDEKAEITIILDNYLQGPWPDWKTHVDHIRRMIDFRKNHPNERDIFYGKRIFLGQGSGMQQDTPWCQPWRLYIDSPLLETGLSAIEGLNDMWMVHPRYGDSLSKKDFIEFAKSLGVQTGLKITRIQTNENPARRELQADYRYGVRWSSAGIDCDWTIANLKKFTLQPTLQSSRLIWTALTSASPEVAKARFRPNQQYSTREADSQLVFHLKNTAWIPDSKGIFHKPQDVGRHQLLTGLLFDDRNGLLTAIGFEEAILRQTVEYKRKELVAQEVGFKDLGTATDIANALRASGLDPKQAAELIRNAGKPEQPEEQVRNPTRRREGILVRRENAPSNEAVRRERSIQPKVSKALAEGRAYLRAKYTNLQGQMVCQVCRGEMPFKLASSEYYFEAVQIIRGLDQHFFANRLAACPNCAAMYQHARTCTDSEMTELISSVVGDATEPSLEVEVVLAGTLRPIRFVGTHLFDLKTLIKGSNPDHG